MSQPYVGQILAVGFNFAPVGWAFCDGSLQAISENETLYTLLGTTYGGDGVNTFALPDLRGRVLIHQGGGFVMGQQGGTETVTLAATQLPAHTHALQASNLAGSTNTPTSATNLATTSTPVPIYAPPGTNVALAPQAIGASGGSQPHDNLQPLLVVNYIISLFGVFPSQN
jgi:microcystin-dependent protein